MKNGNWVVIISVILPSYSGFGSRSSWAFFIYGKKCSATSATLLAMGAAGSVKSPASKASIVPVEPVTGVTTFKVRLKSQRTAAKKQEKEKKKTPEASKKKGSVLTPLLESDTEGADEYEIDMKENQLYHPWFQWPTSKLVSQGADKAWIVQLDEIALKGMELGSTTCPAMYISRYLPVQGCSSLGFLTS